MVHATILPRIVIAAGSKFLKDNSSLRSSKIDDVQKAGALLGKFVVSVDTNLKHMMASARPLVRPVVLEDSLAL